MTGAADIPSPCTGICRIDPATRACAGCHRTLDEITRWPDATAGEKRAILVRIETMARR